MLLVLDTSEPLLTSLQRRGPATRHFKKIWHEPSILATATSYEVGLLDSGNPRGAPQTDLEFTSTKPADVALSIRHGAKYCSRCLYQPHGLLIYVTRRGSGLFKWRIGTIVG